MQVNEPVIIILQVGKVEAILKNNNSPTPKNNK
jgi:hypothetical protein